MTNPSQGPVNDTARSRMHALIAGLRRRKPSVDDATGADTVVDVDDDDRLAEVVRRAVNVLRDDSAGEAGEGPAYLESGAVVGRYVVLRQLGAGGMGVVYAAYDPKLDRKVALKLVRPGMVGDGDARARLLREAQALAKLSHRNVVAIHDVGTMDEQVWLAMEFLRGQTLREWLRERRSWREVLEVMCEAGRGLAAAHAAGMLHRDFKPDNVMIGRDGQVRVMDFGLARARPNGATLEVEESTATPMPVVRALALGVTQVGAVLGTPRYMAPEQFLGREPTPAVDQFALCVALWEALYGERPFGGDLIDELIDDVIEGRVRKPTRGRRVPGWLRRVCMRGLRFEANARFESMEALLEALAKGKTRARVRMGVVGAGVLAVLGVGVEGYRTLAVAQRAAACEATGDEVTVAWNEERRQVLHDAIVATGRSDAPTTAEKVMPWLDRQAEEWREARVEACLDVEVRGRWDATMLDYSLWCLDERRMELESLVDELTLADAEVMHKAVQAAAGLASVDACRNVDVLAALSPPSREERKAVRAVRADVVRAENLERAGSYEKGLALARGVLERAEGLEWRPLSAAARLRLGSLLSSTGAYAQAETVLEDAYFEASEGVAPEVAFGAASRLVAVVGLNLHRYADGRRWGRHAEGILTSIHDGERLKRAKLLGSLAGVEWSAGAYDEAMDLGKRSLAIHREVLGPEHPNVASGLANLALLHKDLGAYDEARVLYQQALEIGEKVLGPEHPTVLNGLDGLAGVHWLAGAYDEAKALHERVLAIQERTLGPEHPTVAMALQNLAGDLFAMGDYGKAKALNEQALEIRERSLGPEHPNVATSLGGLANVYSKLGAIGEARALNERALAIRETALGAEHPNVAKSLNSLAFAHAKRGDHERALRLGERALAIVERALGAEHINVTPNLDALARVHWAMGAHDHAIRLLERARSKQEEVLGAEHPDVAHTVDSLAGVYVDVGAYEEAGALYERALASMEQALGPQHPDVAYPLVGLAVVALAQGRPLDALRSAERAVLVREQHGIGGGHLAAAHFALARALWEAPADQGRDRMRAVAVAERAREALAHVSEYEAKALAHVEGWLVAHGHVP